MRIRRESVNFDEIIKFFGPTISDVKMLQCYYKQTFMATVTIIL